MYHVALTSCASHEQSFLCNACKCVLKETLLFGGHSHNFFFFKAKIQDAGSEIEKNARS